MIVFSVLITVMIVIWDSVVVFLQEFEQPIYLEGIFGLAHINTHGKTSFWSTSFRNSAHFLQSANELSSKH